MVETQFSKIVW